MSDDGGIVGEVDEDSKKDEQKEDEKEGGEDKEQISNKRSLEDNGESDRNKRPATEESSKALSSNSAPFVAADTVMKVVVPNTQAGALIGKGGCAIRTVRETSGAKINVSDNSGLDRIVTITGSQSSVQLAYTLINQNIAACAAPGEHSNLKVAPASAPDMEQHTVRLLVPDSQAGGLIGKGGAMINAIRTQSGAHVKVANKGEMGHGATERMVTIKGSREACQTAQSLISAKLIETAGSVSTQQQASNNPFMSMPGMNAGMGGYDQGLGGMAGGMAGMYGMAGLGMAGMMNGYDMKGMGGMTGMGAQGMAGMNGMNNGMSTSAQYNMPNTQATQVQVPNDVIGKVIGKGGSAISEIRNNSMAKIEIAHNDPVTNMRVITITGTPEQTQMAQYLISLKMVEQHGR